ncbi:MAG: translation elongation factor Ts [Bacteroidales bacterium]|jgi:elongation factor Ts|nr:translation elongation factor Ts [Bacteroidales bacterium]
MAAITAADVNKLRQMTGAGMMDCKKALSENDGNFDKAIDFLRKQGQKLAAKRADRSANEGMVLAQCTTDGKYGAIVLISSETDFVAKNADFQSFVKSVSDLAIANKPKSLDEAKAVKMADGRPVEDHVTDLVGKIGEKIEFAQFECLEDANVVAYNHHGNRLATLVSFNGEIPQEVANDVAMQTAAMAPVALDQSAVTQEDIDRELEIARDQARQEGKAEDKIEMIAQGRLNKFFKESTLVNQEFIKDNKQTVAQYVKAKAGNTAITGFRRVMLGA